MTILFIEDELQRNAALVEYFELVEEWKVILAASPREAVECMETQGGEIDVVLLDIMMPPDEVVDISLSNHGRDTGTLLISRIEEELPGIPIVILTARREYRAPESQSVKEVLYKPKSPREVVKVLKDFGSSSHD